MSYAKIAAAVYPTEAAEPTAGVWFVYSWDWNAYPLNVFGDELEARRWADSNGYGEVVWWPFGVEWNEVDK